MLFGDVRFDDQWSHQPRKKAARAKTKRTIISQFSTRKTKPTKKRTQNIHFQYCWQFVALMVHIRTSTLYIIIFVKIQLKWNKTKNQEKKPLKTFKTNVYKQVTQKRNASRVVYGCKEVKLAFFVFIAIDKKKSVNTSSARARPDTLTKNRTQRIVRKFCVYDHKHAHTDTQSTYSIYIKYFRVRESNRSRAPCTVVSINWVAAAL